MVANRVWLSGVLVLAMALMGCGGETSGGTIGEEGGVCRTDGTCNSGLTCASNLCVQLDTSGDAAADTPTDNNPADTGPDATADVPDVPRDFGGDSSIPPAAPVELMASAEAGPSVSLTWTDVADNEGSYLVERMDAVLNTQWMEIALLPANFTTYDDATVYKGVDYTYRVRAANTTGLSDYSNEALAATPPPTFEDDMIAMFERSCGANDAGCHFRNQFAATADRACRGWLALENASIGAYVYDEMGNNMQSTNCPDQPLYNRLTEVNSWQCNQDNFVNGGRPYVVPGNLDESYLWAKVAGIDMCDNGNPDDAGQMPPGVVLPEADRMLLRQWILAGAPQR